MLSLNEVLGPCQRCFLLSRYSSFGTQQFRLCSRTHYEVLGVSKTASLEDIKNAYLEKSKMFHPDANPSDSSMHQKFVRLNDAYMTLGKASSRKMYDMSLVANLYQQQHLRQHVYKTHTSGSTTRPGTGFDSDSSDEHVFWDETIWHMRDKSADQYYVNKPFYGIKGVNRKSNRTIAICCVILMFFGICVHLFVVRLSRKKQAAILDKHDKENSRHLREAKANAELYGREEQVILLQHRIEAAIAGRGKRR